jgi:hypothetical protein
VREGSDAQANVFNHQILEDPAGEMRENHRILQKNIGNRWNMEAVFRSEMVRIFSVDSC